MKRFFGVVFALVLLLALVVTTTACRNDAYGNFGADAEILRPGIGILRGTVSIDNGGGALRAVAAPIANAEVWLEERPDLRSPTNASGVYEIVGVPAGVFHVVGKSSQATATFKMRSPAATLAQEGVTQVDLGLRHATNIVRGVLTDENGQPLASGTVVYLWGEPFFVRDGGRFETPPLPTFTGFDAINSIVVNRGLPQEFSAPVSFVSSGTPLEVALTIPQSGLTASAPPKVTLLASKDGQNRTSATANEQLSITAVVYPADSPETALTWSATRGTLGNTSTVDGDRRTRTWTAPTTRGLATVTIRIATTAGKMATASLPLYVIATDTFTVTYNGNGNTGGAVPTDGGTYETGATVTVLGNTGNLVKTGHTFAGWNTESSGSGTDRATGSTFLMGGSNITLYAKWTVNPTFTVTYNGNRNTGDNSYGLYQINMIDRLGPARLRQYNLRSNEDLFDPATNIRVMMQMSGNCTNWQPWSAYKNGSYRRFLNQYPPR